MGPLFLLPASLLSILLVLSHLTLYTSAQCEACSNYAHDISDCSADFNQNVATGQAPMGPVAISCMCVTGYGLSNMLNCFNCNDVGGFQLALLETWIVMCNTDNVAGPNAALNCWNTNVDYCVAVQGVPFPGRSSIDGGASQTTSLVESAAASTDIPTTIDVPDSATASAAVSTSARTLDATSTPASTAISSTMTSVPAATASSKQSAANASVIERALGSLHLAAISIGVTCFLIELTSL